MNRSVRARPGAGRRRLTGLAGLAVAGAALVAGACGVPADDKPRPISQEQIPGDGGTDARTTPGARTAPADLYFTDFDGEQTLLAPVEVPVPMPAGASASETPPPGAVLETLLAGPGETAAAKGFGTTIPPKTSLAGQPELDAGGVLTIDLTPAIFDVRSPGSRLAFGQIVCTADALPGVEAVRFQIEGKSQPVPMGDGEASSEPLTCASYDNLARQPKNTEATS
jgi:spore germination protein GerM